MTPEQALREAIDHTRFIADHLEGRMGEGALADMLMMADEWGKALTTPLDEQLTPEQAQDELVREGQERGEYGDDAVLALPAKWRAEMEAIRRGVPGGDHDTMRACADELERALASSAPHGGE